jgi:hypothetical protein
MVFLTRCGNRKLDVPVLCGRGAGLGTVGLACAGSQSRTVTVTCGRRRGPAAAPRRAGSHAGAGSNDSEVTGTPWHQRHAGQVHLHESALWAFRPTAA